MRELLTRRGIVMFLVLGLASIAVAQEDNATRGPSALRTTCSGDEVFLVFDDEGDAFVFNLEPTSNGKVKVRVADCCLFGPDVYRIDLFEVGKPGRSKVTDGQVDHFSGNSTLGVQVGKSYKAIISPDSVPAGFPAGATACFEGPVTVDGPLPED